MPGNDDGFNTTPVAPKEPEPTPVKDNKGEAHYAYDPNLSAEQNLANLYDSQMAQFEEYYVPILEHMQEQADSQEIVERGREDAAEFEAKTQEQMDREMSRYASAPTVAQQANLDRNMQDIYATGESAILNNSRVAQREYTEATTQALMQMGSAMQEGSTAGMAQLANQQAQREAQADAQSKGMMGSVLGTVGAVAGAVVGGPAGAAVGGALGSSAGSIFG